MFADVANETFGPPMTESDTPRRARLPDVALGRLAGVGTEGDEAVPLRASRRGTALVLLGEALAPRDAEYLRQLADAAPALAEWDGRVLVLVAGGAGAGIIAALAELALPFPVLADPDGTVAAAAGVAAPAVVVADQWGEVREARGVTDTQPWLAPAELEQWMRFLSIQCAG